MATDPYKIEQLTKDHDRASFDCGVLALNTFLQKHARQNATSNSSRTYVATLAEDAKILGYFTLAAGRVSLEDVPDEQRKRLRLPRHAVPVVLLGRLAVDQTARGLGLGSRLLIEGLERAAMAAELIGAAAVEVDAKDEKARSFYKKFGFLALVDDERHMWLAMKTVKALLGGPPR